MCEGFRYFRPLGAKQLPLECDLGVIHKSYLEYARVLIAQNSHSLLESDEMFTNLASVFPEETRPHGIVYSCEFAKDIPEDEDV